jgi:hypothetical protein
MKAACSRSTPHHPSRPTQLPSALRGRPAAHWRRCPRRLPGGGAGGIGGPAQRVRGWRVGQPLWHSHRDLGRGHQRGGAGQRGRLVRGNRGTHCLGVAPFPGRAGVSGRRHWCGALGRALGGPAHRRLGGGTLAAPEATFPAGQHTAGSPAARHGAAGALARADCTRPPARTGGDRIELHQRPARDLLSGARRAATLDPLPAPRRTPGHYPRTPAGQFGHSVCVPGREPAPGQPARILWRWLHAPDRTGGARHTPGGRTHHGDWRGPPARTPQRPARQGRAGLPVIGADCGARHVQHFPGRAVGGY